MLILNIITICFNGEIIIIMIIIIITPMIIILNISPSLLCVLFESRSACCSVSVTDDWAVAIASRWVDAETEAVSATTDFDVWGESGVETEEIVAVGSGAFSRIGTVGAGESESAVVAAELDVCAISWVGEEMMLRTLGVGMGFRGERGAGKGVVVPASGEDAKEQYNLTMYICMVPASGKDVKEQYNLTMYIFVIVSWHIIIM